MEDLRSREARKRCRHSVTRMHANFHLFSFSAVTRMHAAALHEKNQREQSAKCTEVKKTKAPRLSSGNALSKQVLTGTTSLE